MMMEFLQFTFQTRWHYIGVLVLLALLAGIIGMVLSGIASIVARKGNSSGS